MRVVSACCLPRPGTDPAFPSSLRREEQHDDQLLHELLRCVKALATSDVGCVAIRACTPNPFIPLVNLLFTDKKPGDVPTRQLMTEILTLLFDLYPTRPAAPRWPGDEPAGREYVYPLPREYSSLPQLVRELLLGEDKDKDLVDFVTAARRPRVFKTYLTEISDVWCVCLTSSSSRPSRLGADRSSSYLCPS